MQHLREKKIEEKTADKMWKYCFFSIDFSFCGFEWIRFDLPCLCACMRMHAYTVYFMIFISTKKKRTHQSALSINLTPTDTQFMQLLFLKCEYRLSAKCVSRLSRFFNLNSFITRTFSMFN